MLLAFINQTQHCQACGSSRRFSIHSGLERPDLPCMYLPHHECHCHSAALQIANMLVAAKADDVCILDVSSQCSFTEHMVLATGRSHRHIQAAAAAVAYQVSLRCMSQIRWCSHLCKCKKHSALTAQCRAALLQVWTLCTSTRKSLQAVIVSRSLFTVGLLLAQMSLRCSEVAPGTRPSVEGEDGSDWCVVDAGTLCVVPLIEC